MKPDAIALAVVVAAAALAQPAYAVSNLDAARCDCGTPGPHGVDCQVRRLERDF